MASIQSKRTVLIYGSLSFYCFLFVSLSLPYLSFASPLRTVCPYLNVRLVRSTLWSPIGLYHAFINHRGANYTQSKQYSRQKLTVCAKKTMNFLDIAFINHKGAKYLKVNNHIRYSKVLLELIIIYKNYDLSLLHFHQSQRC